MKKHLIAAAVAAAVAVPAMAQVTISGVLDYAVVSDRATGASNITGVVDSMRSTSLITFRGTEDLGGGLKAGFVLNSDLGRGSLTGRMGSMGTSNADTPMGDTTTTATAVDRFFSREAMLTLEGAFGIVHLGRTRTVVDEQNNAHAQGFNTNLNNTSGGTATHGLQGLNGRLDNTVRYVSPAFSGARLHVSQTSGELGRAGDILTLGLTYAQGALSAHAAQATGKATLAANDKTFQTFGASYNAGVAVLAVNFNDLKDNVAGTAGNKGQHLTVGIPLGGAYRAVLGAHNYTSRATATLGAKSMVTTAGVDYNLSKRTTAYFAYTAKSGAHTATGFRNTAAAAADASATRFGVGVAHSF